MSVIPANWTRTRIFASGYSPSYTVYIERPIPNVCFATVVSINSIADVVAIDGLNNSYALTRDASGNTYRFPYFANTTGLSASDYVMFPTDESHKLGQAFSSLTIRFLDTKGEGGIFLVTDVNSIELDLWSYTR